MNIPENLKYSRDHEWIEMLDSGALRIGITDYAQDRLGDLVFVELKENGAEFAKSEVLGEVESTKSVSEIFSPISGTLSDINGVISENPELVNSDPYGEGWICEMLPSQKDELDELLTAAEYKELISAEEE